MTVESSTAGRATKIGSPVFQMVETAISSSILASKSTGTAVNHRPWNAFSSRGLRPPLEL